MFRARRKGIAKFEREWNYDASYIRDMVDASPRAAWLFSRVTRSALIESGRGPTSSIEGDTMAKQT